MGRRHSASGAKSADKYYFGRQNVMLAQMMRLGAEEARREMAEEATLPLHPYADLFPRMLPDEYNALKRDIAENGLLEPVLVWDGQIADGRHRAQACYETGTPLKTVTFEGDEAALLKAVIARNLHRRHLNSSQRAMLAVRIKQEIEQHKQVGRPPKDSKQKIQEIIPEFIDDHAAALPDDRQLRQPAPQSRDEAATIMGTNPRYVSDAEKLQATAPDVAAAVAEGVVNIPDAKRLAKLDVDKQAEALARVRAGEQAKAVVQQQRREQRSSTIQQQAALEGRFPVIYADPPWQYESQATANRDVENHYPTQTTEWISALSVDGRTVAEIAADQAVLFLWATAPKLVDAMQVIEAWGFEYRTCMVWDKERIGQGYYVRVQHELLLIARRGDMPVPDPSARPSSVYRELRGDHSVKPLHFYTLIERMYPNVQRLELFARHSREGWHGWGLDYGRNS